MTEEIVGWYWMGDDRRLHYPPYTPIVPAETIRVAGTLAPPTNGMQGSLTVLDALRYAPGFTVVRTRHGGEITSMRDRLWSRTLAACWILDARMVTLGWLCAVLDRCFARVRVLQRAPDSRSIKALTVLQGYVEGGASITDVRTATYPAARAANDADAAFHALAHTTGAVAAGSTSYAAASAFASAARAAAYAARAAAIATPNDAVTNANAAAANAAYVARAAINAYTAEWEWLNGELERRLIAAHKRG